MVTGNFGGSQGALPLTAQQQSVLKLLANPAVFAGTQQICVQSMDGQLSFIEKEAVIFARFLPKFLLPGPLCYSLITDCFITCSSAFEIQCYKYQALAAAQAASEKSTGMMLCGILMETSLHMLHYHHWQCFSGTESGSPVQGRRLHTEWQWTFGEMAWDIQAGQFTGVLLQESQATFGKAVTSLPTSIKATTLHTRRHS